MFTISSRRIRGETRAQMNTLERGETRRGNCVYRVFSLAREATQIHLISQGSG